MGTRSDRKLNQSQPSKSLLKGASKSSKKKSYAALKRQLDKCFSVWTRRRFSDPNGLVACNCCGAVKRWQEQQAAHFVSRAYLGTRFEPENVGVSCFQCNVFKKGNLAAYAAWGVNWYGMDWPARMVALSRTETKLTRADLQQMIEDYEAKIKAL